MVTCNPKKLQERYQGSGPLPYNKESESWVKRNEKIPWHLFLWNIITPVKLAYIIIIMKSL